jgi:hypothetical protein
MKCDNCNQDVKLLYSIKVETLPNGYGRRMDCCRVCLFEFVENEID